MKVLLIEDEKPASTRLQKLLHEVDTEIEILDVLDSIENSIEWLNTHPMPKLIFMDIQLSDGLSFSIFKKTKVECPVIFITAYDEYAIDAFKVNSIDYLLKPVKKQDLETALLKFKNLQFSYSSLQFDALSIDKQKQYKDRFIIKLGNKIKQVIIEDIAYFFSRDKLSFICDKEGKSYPIDLSLDKIEALIDPSIFFRVNRQIIAHHQAIKDIQTSIKSRIILTLEPPTQIEALISSERSSLFKKWIKKE